MAINTKQPGDCGYIAFYKGNRVEVYAPTLLKARSMVATHFKCRKEWQINIMIAEREDGSTVIHTAVD